MLPLQNIFAVGSPPPGKYQASNRGYEYMIPREFSLGWPPPPQEFPGL